MYSANQQTVLDFYEAALNQKDFDRARPLLGSSYTQHNPRIADGIAGFAAFLRDIRAQFPDLRAEVKQLFEDGDYAGAAAASAPTLSPSISPRYPSTCAAKSIG